MQKNDLLFVYGTLRKGERADLRSQVHQHDVVFCGMDVINGELYHLHSYPGVKTTPQDIFNESMPCVTGEVFRITHPSIIAFLDAYEGYNSDRPESGLYDRLQTKTAAGRLVWVYTYNGPVTSEQLILDGDWCKNRSMTINSRMIR
jgi:gamma-glutamylcyclotransferase (GGCT)/AIG2-like uncharacterized protein YtfP